MNTLPSTIVYLTKGHLPARWDDVRSRDWWGFWKKTHYPGYRQTGNDFNKVFSLQYTNIRSATTTDALAWQPPSEHAIQRWVCKGRYSDGGCNCHGCEHLDSLTMEFAVGLLSKINSCCRAYTDAQKAVRRQMGAPLSLDRYIIMKERLKRGELATDNNPVPAIVAPVIIHAPAELPPRIIRTFANVYSPDLTTPTKIKLKINDEIDCSICMDPDAKGIQLTLDDCGHQFCYGCATQWLNQNNSCPICRGAISRTEIKRCEDFMKLMGMYMN